MNPFLSNFSLIVALVMRFTTPVSLSIVLAIVTIAGLAYWLGPGATETAMAAVAHNWPR